MGLTRAQSGATISSPAAWYPLSPPVPLAKGAMLPSLLTLMKAELSIQYRTIGVSGGSQTFALLDH
jgi:hypothetical protein